MMKNHWFYSKYFSFTFYPTCNYQNTEITFGGPEENYYRRWNDFANSQRDISNMYSRERTWFCRIFD